MEQSTDKSLNLTSVQCCVCETEDAKKIGAGEDFEYRTSPDVFSVMQCNLCDLVYLNPRPSVSEFDRIYLPNYHAFDFSEEDFGFVHKIRARLEAKRLLDWCKDLPDNARIIDVGCGDGFHLRLLQAFGKKSWRLEGVDISSQAVEAAEKSNLKVHFGSVEEIGLPKDTYDLAFMIQTIEHVEKPDAVLSAVREILKPNGRVVIVTDNTDSIDFDLFKKSYWGGYHFPRHWNLFNQKSLTKLAEKTGFAVADLATAVSPVNWVYSIHNALVAKGAPRFFVNRFTLKSFVSLSAFTLLDIVLQKFGKGALLRAILQKT